MTFTKDLIERAVRTFLQAALAVLAADVTGLTDIATAKAIGLAAISAGISAVMSLIARNIGPADSASVLVPSTASVGVPDTGLDLEFPEDPNQPPLPGTEPPVQ